MWGGQGEGSTGRPRTAEEPLLAVPTQARDSEVGAARGGVAEVWLRLDGRTRTGPRPGREDGEQAYALEWRWCEARGPWAEAPLRLRPEPLPEGGLLASIDLGAELGSGEAVEVRLRLRGEAARLAVPQQLWLSEVSRPMVVALGPPPAPESYLAWEGRSLRIALPLRLDAVDAPPPPWASPALGHAQGRALGLSALGVCFGRPVYRRSK